MQRQTPIGARPGAKQRDAVMKKNWHRKLKQWHNTGG
jgi:hypothetical protein